MKTKLGFLDFSHTKEKNVTEEPLDVDLLIKELLDFATETERKSAKRVKDKNKEAISKNDTVESDISVPVAISLKDTKVSKSQSTSDIKNISNHKEATTERPHSTGHKTKRMVRNVLIKPFKTSIFMS